MAPVAGGGLNDLRQQGLRIAQQQRAEPLVAPKFGDERLGGDAQRRAFALNDGFGLRRATFL